VDVKRAMLFAPLGSPNKDFYGGDRAGSDLYANSIVALDANTGKLKRYFQTVHPDNWHYDGSSAPILITVKHNGKSIRAVKQTDKNGTLHLAGCKPSLRGQVRGRLRKKPRRPAKAGRRRRSV